MNEPTTDPEYSNYPLDEEGYRMTDDGIKFKFETVANDPRFPNCDQSYRCWQKYVDFHKCKQVLNDKHPACQTFLKAYQTICPDGWIERWDDNLQNGILPFNLEPPEEMLIKVGKKGKSE